MQISGSELFSNEWSKIHIFWPFLGPAGPLGPRGEKEPRLRYQWVQLIEKQEKKNLTKKIFFDQKLPFYRQGLLKKGFRAIISLQKFVQFIIGDLLV